jgi:hypothetical protein
MDEAMRQEVVQRHQAGASIRSIAKDLGISPGAVVRAVARVQAQREGRAAPVPGPRPRRQHSIIDPFEPLLEELLAKYPNLTVERAWPELRERGFTGGYTVVRARVRLLRPRPAPAPVPRFETGPGQQAQMDFGVYDIDFTREGRRRVYLFSYLLAYSRRQYLRKESPRARHAREQPHLLPLPACDFDTALVIYRHVNVEGFIAYRLNFYSVPWSHIGQVLPVRVSDDEVIIYSISLEEIARHGRLPSTQSGVRQVIKGHHPANDPGQRTLLLRQRFGELGPVAVQFLDGLLAKQIQGKLQAQQLLALVAHYQRDDVLAALERAVRFGAFSLVAMRRILAAHARPKPLLDELAELHKGALDPSLREEPIGPRPTSDYQHLLSPEEAAEPPSEERPGDQADAEPNQSEPA